MDISDISLCSYFLMIGYNNHNTEVIIHNSYFTSTVVINYKDVYSSVTRFPTWRLNVERNPRVERTLTVEIWKLIQLYLWASPSHSAHLNYDLQKYFCLKKLRICISTLWNFFHNWHEWNNQFIFRVFYVINYRHDDYIGKL